MFIDWGIIRPGYLRYISNISPEPSDLSVDPRGTDAFRPRGLEARTRHEPPTPALVSRQDRNSSDVPHRALATRRARWAARRWSGAPCPPEPPFVSDMSFYLPRVPAALSMSKPCSRSSMRRHRQTYPATHLRRVSGRGHCWACWATPVRPVPPRWLAPALSGPRQNPGLAVQNAYQKSFSKNSYQRRVIIARKYDRHVVGGYTIEVRQRSNPKIQLLQLLSCRPLEYPYGDCGGLNG